MIKFGLIIVWMKSCWREFWGIIQLRDTLNMFLIFVPEHINYKTSHSWNLCRTFYSSQAYINSCYSMIQCNDKTIFSCSIMEGLFKLQTKNSHLWQSILVRCFMSSTGGGVGGFMQAGESEPWFDTTSVWGWAIWISRVCKVIGMEGVGGRGFQLVRALHCSWYDASWWEAV